MDELLVEFKSESKDLISELMTILEDLEDDPGKVKDLENYGQIVDRIMGGAKSLAMAVDDSETLNRIGTYAELCKAVGYKGSQIEGNEEFANIVIALLLDATEMLEQMVVTLGTDQQKDIKQHLNQTFLDRLTWVSDQFAEGTRASVAIQGKGEKVPEAQKQVQLDDLLAQLGLT